MSMPSQMFDHVMDARRGLRVSSGLALTHELPIEDNTNNRNLKRGMIGYRDPATGTFILGLPTDKNVMPLLARNSYGDWDTTADGAPGAQAGSGAFGNNKGISTFPATGAIEAFSSEVVGGRATIDTLQPNTFLTAGEEGTADAGKIMAGEEYVDLVVGIFITAEFHYQGMPGVNYWPFYLPRLTNAQIAKLS